MIETCKVLVVDIDGTICNKKKQNQQYEDLNPNKVIYNKLWEYKNEGFYIILYTSRNMRTYQGNIGRINARTGKTLMEWLDRFDVPYDELHIGKPWCGNMGFYVDDRAIRPSEFAALTYEELIQLLEKEKELP